MLIISAPTQRFVMITRADGGGRREEGCPEEVGGDKGGGSSKGWKSMAYHVYAADTQCGCAEAAKTDP